MGTTPSEFDTHTLLTSNVLTRHVLYEWSNTTAKLEGWVDRIPRHTEFSTVSLTMHGKVLLTYS